MPQRRWLAKVLMFATLELGAMAGVPMRPDQIEELTRLMNKTRVVLAAPEQTDGDGSPDLGRKP